MSRLTDRVVNDFDRADQGSSSAAHKLISDIDADRKQFGRKDNNPDWLDERDRINQKLSDAGTLPKFEMKNGDEEEMKIEMLTSEKGLSHGVVLTCGHGENKQAIVLNEEGKYVEARETANGYVAKAHGKEYEKDEDGVLRLKGREERERDRDREPEERRERRERREESRKPEKSDASIEEKMTKPQQINEAAKLLQMVYSGKNAEASEELRTMNKEDRAKVAQFMKYINEKGDASQSDFRHGVNYLASWVLPESWTRPKTFAPIHFDYEKDKKTGREYPVSVRRAIDGDVDHDNRTGSNSVFY